MVFLRRLLSPVVTFCFIFQSFPIYAAQGNLLNLPEPGKMISLSAKFVPAYVKGISIYPDDPFKFDFIIDTGDAKLNDRQFKEESNRLIKYFMAALTVPEKEDWVNLSPYEKDRIIPESLGVTEMGRDMLAQDYILKQLTSSLIYPEKAIGKEFWSKVYAQAQKQFGTTNIPVNTFNKVWIVPAQAVVWEHDNSAYVVRSHLKVMLEEDYLSLMKHLNNKNAQTTNAAASNVVRAVVLPALEKEVNEGANFAAVRQIFNSAILAAWYKQNLKQTILGQVYANQNKVTGVDIADKQIKQKIYERYLQAFKKGAFNFIKEDNDPVTHQMVPRKYFSGGVVDLAQVTDTLRGDFAQLPIADKAALATARGPIAKVTINMAQTGADAAMITSAEAQRVEYQGHLLRFATDAVRSVAVGLTKAGYVGAVKGLKGDERKKRKAESDLFAQSIVNDATNKNNTIMSIRVNEGLADEVEGSLTPYDITIPQAIESERTRIKKNDDNDQLFHISSGVKYAKAPTILDVIEGTDAAGDNEAEKIMSEKLSGGTSIISVGERVRQIGKVPELYALQFFAYLGEHAYAFKQITQTAKDGNSYPLFDPELYAQNPEKFIKVVEFFQQISGKSKNDFKMEVVVMDRPTEIPLIDQLKLIQPEYPGLIINTIKAGTVAHGVDAVLSPEQYKKVTGQDRVVDAKVMLTRGGAAEAYYNLVLASQLSRTGAVGAVRLVSLQMQKDGHGGEVANQSRRYAFTPDERGQISDLRGTDKYRIEDGRFLFKSNELKGETVTALSAITVNGVLNLPAASTKEATVIAFTNDNIGNPVINMTRQGVDPAQASDTAMLTMKAGNVKELLQNISSVVTVTSNDVKVLNEPLLRSAMVYYLVDEARFGANEDIKKSAQRLLREIGIATGRKEASIHDFYMARLRGEWNNMTVPAINVRTGPTFDTMEDIFTTAERAKVGLVIFELAASETRYTGQDSDEYTAMVYGAAIATGYKGLLFMQADHYQTSAADYFSGNTPDEKAAAQAKAIQKVKDNILKAVLAGKLNIDVDPSTLMLAKELEEVLAFERKITTRYINMRSSVDAEFVQEIERLGGLKEKPEDETDGIWSIRRKLTDDLEIGLEIPEYKNSLSPQEIAYLQKFGLTEQERKEIGSLYQAAHEVTKKVTKIYIEYIRELEKQLGLKTPISIGVEERHIDNPQHAKYPSTVLGSMTLMHDIIQWSKEKGYVPPSKLALQTGTMHGLGGVVDWGIYQRHQLAHREIGVAVFVQHGTSTLAPENFAEMPKAGSGEAHLATEYQKYVFEEIGIGAPALRAQMKTFVEALMDPTATEANLDPVIVEKLKVAKLWDPAKREKDYKNKFLKRYQDTMKGLKEKGWSEDHIFTGMLGDTLPKPYAGKVKDLIKELAAPFKREIAELPKNVYDAIHTRMMEEFARIYKAQNVENTRDLIERIIPYASVQVVLPPRPKALTEAVDATMAAQTKRYHGSLELINAFNAGEITGNDEITSAKYNEGGALIHLVGGTGRVGDIIAQLRSNHGALQWDNFRNSYKNAAIEVTKDAAALANSVHDPLGGINLDPNLYNMQVLRDGNGRVLPIAQQPIGQFMKIKGFKPVFLNIERNINLPARLGVNLDRLPKEQLAQASSVAA